MPIPRHYSDGHRKLNIILTQLRFNASFLNYDLCKVKILLNASCNCGAPCENYHHFFFDCDKYTDNREIIFIKGRSPSNGKLSDFSFYIDSQKSAHRKFKK